MKFVPFEPTHLMRFTWQGPQARHQQWFTLEAAEEAAKHFAMTGIAEDGQVVGCAGIIPMRAIKSPSQGLIPHTSRIWAVFSELIQTHALPVFRLVKTTLDRRPERRIIAQIMPDHTKAAEFAERLDFRFERKLPMPRVGAVSLLYARMRA